MIIFFIHTGKPSVLWKYPRSSIFHFITIGFKLFNSRIIVGKLTTDNNRPILLLMIVGLLYYQWWYTMILLWRFVNSIAVDDGSIDPIPGSWGGVNLPPTPKNGCNFWNISPFAFIFCKIQFLNMSSNFSQSHPVDKSKQYSIFKHVFKFLTESSRT